MEIITILSAAVLVEALIEYGKTIATSFEKKEYKTFITQIASVVIGILIAFLFGVNVFVPLGMAVNEVAGKILTGIVISRGSNYASDLISKITNPVPNNSQDVYIKGI